MQFSPSIKLARNNTIDIELQTDGTHNFKLTNKDFIKNLKTILSINCKQQLKNESVYHSQSGTFQTDYVFGKGTSSLKFAFPNFSVPSTFKTTIGFVFKQDKYAVGVEGNLQAKQGSQISFDNATLNFETKYDLRNTISTALRYSGDFGLTARYSHIHPKFNFASQVSLNQDLSYQGKFGFEKRFIGGGVGKLTLSTEPEVGLSFTKEISEGINFTVATTVPCKTFQHNTG